MPCCAAPGHPSHGTVSGPHEHSAGASGAKVRRDEESFPRRRLPGGSAGRGAVQSARQGGTGPAHSGSFVSDAFESYTTCLRTRSLAEAVVCLLSLERSTRISVPRLRVLTGYSRSASDPCRHAPSFPCFRYSPTRAREYSRTNGATRGCCSGAKAEVNGHARQSRPRRSPSRIQHRKAWHALAGGASPARATEYSGVPAECFRVPQRA